MPDQHDSQSGGRIERTGWRLLRWRVLHSSDEGMGTESLYFTRLGARFSRWLWR